MDLNSVIGYTGTNSKDSDATVSRNSQYSETLEAMSKT